MSSDRVVQGKRFGAVVIAVVAAMSFALSSRGEESPDPKAPEALTTAAPWRAPFRPLPAKGAYVSMVRRGGQYELWTVGWQGMNKEVTHADHIQLTVARGPSPERLAAPKVVEELRPLITDVFDPKDPKTLAPWRALTRSYMIHDPDVGYVLFGCAVPEYFPGAVPLLPAIFTSPDGSPSTWKYLGILGPEPKEESERGKMPIWSDGGGIVHLSNGSWRVYLDKINTGVGVIEAPKLEGPWKFLRNAKGEILDVAHRYSVDSGPGRGTGFTGVLRVSDTEWHLWTSSGWPVKEIWHLWSKDGLDWYLYGDKAEITPECVGNRPIKCLRAYVDEDGKRIIGLLSVGVANPPAEEIWVCHSSWMPVGTPAKGKE